jgi:anti-sigma B factor antagonist
MTSSLTVARTLVAQRTTAGAPLWIHAEPERWGVRLCPYGELDLATIGRLRSKLDQYIAAGCERVVLDLRGLSFLDCTGVHLALDADAAARAAGWELVLIEGPAHVQRVFELAGVRDRLPFVEADTTEPGAGALRAMGGPGLEPGTS